MCRRVDIRWQAVACKDALQDFGRALLRKPHGLGDTCQHGHTGSDAFAMRVLAIAVIPFNGVTNGMTEIKYHPFTLIAFIPFDQASFSLAAPFDDFFPVVENRRVV